jgi:hypothetical protein
VPSAVNRNPVSDLGGGLKVMTLLDDFDAERSHRGIFLDAVPERYDNRRRDSVPASGKSHGLAVIPPRRGYHSVGFSAGAAKLFEIYETSTHLERTSWGVVLVFHPDGRSDPRFEEGPPVLRGRRHGLVNESCGSLERVQRGLVVGYGVLHFQVNAIAKPPRMSAMHHGG